MKKKNDNKRNLQLNKFTVAKLYDPNVIFGGVDGPDTPIQNPKEFKPTGKD